MAIAAGLRLSELSFSSPLLVEADGTPRNYLLSQFGDGDPAQTFGLQLGMGLDLIDDELEAEPFELPSRDQAIETLRAFGYTEDELQGLNDQELFEVLDEMGIKEQLGLPKDAVIPQARVLDIAAIASAAGGNFVLRDSGSVEIYNPAGDSPSSSTLVLTYSPGQELDDDQFAEDKIRALFGIGSGIGSSAMNPL